MPGLIAEQRQARPECRPTDRRSRDSAVTLIELLIVLAIIGILISLLLPAIHAAREAARRATCDDHRRQLGIALVTWEDVHRKGMEYPPKDGRPGGWSLELLPFIEEEALYGLFALDEPLSSPANRQVAAYRPPLFACPVVLEEPSTLEGVRVTNYVLIDPDLKTGKRRKGSVSFTDGAADAQFPWCSSPEFAGATWQPSHTGAFKWFY